MGCGFVRAFRDSGVALELARGEPVRAVLEKLFLMKEKGRT
jgi:hypothetical protein